MMRLQIEVIEGSDKREDLLNKLITRFFAQNFVDRFLQYAIGSIHQHKGYNQAQDSINPPEIILEQNTNQNYKG